MRIPAWQEPPGGMTAEQNSAVERVLSRRGSSGILEIDRALLHSPMFTNVWHNFFDVIHNHSVLTPDIRLIAICRVALLNNASYQWRAHSVALESIDEFNREKMGIVKTRQPTDQGPLDSLQWTTLKYADAMTKDVTVSAELSEEVQNSGLSTQAVVELTITISAYNAVSRILLAIGIGMDDP